MSDGDQQRFPETFKLADALIFESRERGELLTPLKLQKLVFYADAWHLALYDSEITSEGFQAWVHGPVALSQYHRFKDLKWRPIDDESIEYPEISESLKAHVDEIIDVFGSETAVALEIMTHHERPWLDARGDIPEDAPCNNYISKQVTKDYYRSLA
ncbi:type II toxin-antitoxin system antitoxin SocA domain-containing protein [Fulvimarina sp. MAC8]|uniref:Panacea domain-containing protein n=1 Tax=Fulvimarina sp. MAC8 TaxID=3162874 RepID=UPI0032ED752F